MCAKYRKGEKHRVPRELIGGPFSLSLREEQRSLPTGEDTRGKSGVTTEPKLSLSPKALTRMQEGLIGKS